MSYAILPMEPQICEGSFSQIFHLGLYFAYFSKVCDACRAPGDIFMREKMWLQLIWFAEPYSLKFHELHFSSSFFTPFSFTFQLDSRLKIEYFSLAFICHQVFCQPTSGAKTMSKIAIAVTNFEMYFSSLIGPLMTSLILKIPAH